MHGVTREPQESDESSCLEINLRVRRVELRPGGTQRRTAREDLLGEVGLRICRPYRHSTLRTRRSDRRENDGDANPPERYQRAAWHCFLTGQKEFLCDDRTRTSLWHRIEIRNGNRARGEAGGIGIVSGYRR